MMVVYHARNLFIFLSGCTDISEIYKIKRTAGTDVKSALLSLVWGDREAARSRRAGVAHDTYKVCDHT